MKNATSTKNAKAKKPKAKSQPAATFTLSGSEVSKILNSIVRPKETANEKVSRFNKELTKLEQKMFDHFKGRVTPVQLMEWVAEANFVIACSDTLTNEQRDDAGSFLWDIGFDFLPKFIKPGITPDEIKESLIETLTHVGEYERMRSGLRVVANAYLSQDGSSSVESVAGFMKPLTLFLELMEILNDYETYTKWLWKAENENAAA